MNFAICDTCPVPADVEQKLGELLARKLRTHRVVLHVGGPVRMPAAVFALRHNLAVEAIPDPTPVTNSGRNGLHGRIDRIVWYSGSDGTPAAEVLDFKTDDVPVKAVPSRTGRYGPQIAAYTRAVAAFGRLPTDRITATLVFTVPGLIEGVRIR